MTTKSQRTMQDDGAPACVFINAAQRRTAWEKNPPSTISKFTDPRLEASLQMRAEEKKIKAAARIKKLLDSKNQPSRIDTTGMRWNTRFCRWEPNEELKMSQKTVIHAYDKNGKLVARCTAAIAVKATPEQIREKVGNVFARGKSVTAVSLTTPEGQPAGAWELRDGVPVENPASYQAPALVTAAPAEVPSSEAAATEESDMASNGNGRHKAAKSARAGNGNGSARRSRATVTLELLKTWTSAEELANAFKKEFGDGKLVTARQAIYKVPKAAKRKVESKKDDTRGTLYRFA